MSKAHRSFGVTDKVGRFDTGPLRPGNYKIKVSPDDPTDAAFWAGPFELGSFEQKDVGALLPPLTGELRLRCRFPRGLSSHYTRVSLSRVGGVDSHWLICNPQGIAKKRLPVGSYFLRFQGHGVVDVWDRKVEIRAGEATDVSLQLEAGVRRRLCFRPEHGVVWDLGEVVEVSIQNRTTKQMVFTGTNYPIIQGEIAAICSTGSGVYDVRLLATDGQRWEGVIDGDSISTMKDQVTVWMSRRQVAPSKSNEERRMSHDR